MVNEPFENRSIENKPHELETSIKQQEAETSNELVKQARELERFQQETQLVSSVDTIGSNILAQNIFIETNDEQSKLSFLETCTELIQNDDY